MNLELESNKRQNLARSIGQDMKKTGIWCILLLVSILASGLGVAYITNQSRMVIATQNQLQIKQEQLNIEWRNQLLEENALAETSRISHIAETKLQMSRPLATQEVIVH